MIPPGITSIVMSDYFAGHPQYYMTYSIYVQALYGEELNVANRSNLVTAGMFALHTIRTMWCNVYINWFAGRF